MSGMTAKIVPTAYIWARDTGTIVSSTKITGANRAVTGLGAIATQIATSLIEN